MMYTSVLSVALASLAFVFPITTGRAIEPIDKRQNDGFHWVNTWTSMPQLVESSNMPPSPFVRLLECYTFQTSTNAFLELGRCPKGCNPPSDPAHVRRHIQDQDRPFEYVWRLGPSNHRGIHRITCWWCCRRKRNTGCTVGSNYSQRKEQLHHSTGPSCRQRRNRLRSQGAEHDHGQLVQSTRPNWEQYHRTPWLTNHELVRKWE
jgi:hypothetical protein